MRFVTILAALAVAAPSVASAGSTEEILLRHRLSVTPDDQMTMARLAAVYGKEGKSKRAQRLYRGLVALENVQLDRSDGVPIWSHQLARERMARAPEPRLRLSSRAD